MGVVARTVTGSGQHRLAHPHHAQHAFGGAVAPSTANHVVAAAVARGNLIEYLNQNRECNGGIQIAFGNMEMQAFGNQAETNHQQKA